MYLAHFGLREEPFRLTPDPRFLHLAEPHRTALSKLFATILRRKGFHVLTGEVGTGKTTLLHAILQILSQAKVERNQVVSAFLVNPTLSREEFVEAVLEDFGIACATPSKPRQLAALHNFLVETHRKCRTAVLIIDEAHLLSLELLEEVRLLSNLDTHRDKLLQVVLCGQPELKQMLSCPEATALRERIACQCQLRSLTLNETRAYIAERLHAAGLRGSSPFSSAGLEEVFRYSRGVPRRINLLCDASLVAGFNLQAKSISADMVQDAASELGWSEPIQNERTERLAPEVPQQSPPATKALDFWLGQSPQGHSPVRSK